MPSNLQKDHVRIRQTSIGVNFIDTYHRSGIYPLPSKTPVCPGLEAAGEIIDLGTEVEDFNIGDRVCYAAVPLGAYCEIRDFPSSKIIKIHFLSSELRYETCKAYPYLNVCNFILFESILD